MIGADDDFFGAERWNPNNNEICGSAGDAMADALTVAIAKHLTDLQDVRASSLRRHQSAPTLLLLCSATCRG